MIVVCTWKSLKLYTVHGCPDKMSDQIQSCSDILKYGQTLLQCMQILHYLIASNKIVKYIMKP